MIPVRYLVDTSALVRILRNSRVRTQWEQQITAGVVALCPVVELEFLYTARSKAERDELTGFLTTTFNWIDMPDRVFSRAADVQAALTAHGTHRSAGAVDLMIAATAELSQVTLVHYDRDFDQISAVTGQPMTWLAEPGDLD